MSKTDFKSFCESHPEIPLFLTYDWISEVVPENNWNVVVCGKGKDLKGFLVFFKKKKAGFSKITLPPLTPYMGPYINYPEGQKKSKKFGYEKKVLEELIDQLPSTDGYIQNFHPSITNWLPFYWNGYDQNTRYTYILNDLSNPDQLFKAFKDSTRREIKKAEKSLVCEESEDLSLLQELKRKDYQNKGLPLPHDIDYLKKVDNVGQKRNCRKMYVAKDEENNPHAGIYLLWDEEYCYYLIGAVNPEFKNSGAMSLLMWKGIQFASNVSSAFNFEGSMVEPIERFFRAFGGDQVSYHSVRKTNSIFLRGKESLDYLLFHKSFSK